MEKIIQLALRNIAADNNKHAQTGEELESVLP
jgi:hypothetical protein